MAKFDDLTADNIFQWCKTHPDPEMKKQYEKELTRVKELMVKSKKEDTE